MKRLLALLLLACGAFAQQSATGVNSYLGTCFDTSGSGTAQSCSTRIGGTIPQKGDVIPPATSAGLAM